MDLFPDDIVILDQIASERTRNEVEKSSLLSLLISGFSSYGTDCLIEKYHSRENLFQQCSDRLIDNIDHTGKTCEEVFGSGSGRAYLCCIVKNLGIPRSDVEDVVQDITRKFLVSNWVERYNPLMSSWPSFIATPVRNYISTYQERGGKKLLKRATSLDYSEDDLQSVSRRLFSSSQNASPDEVMVVKELIHEWELFLEVQPSMKGTIDLGFKKMCTLLPPGTEDIPLIDEANFGVLSQGPYKSRVTTSEWHAESISYMVPNELLVDYISRDPETGGDLYYFDTGEWITQKFYFNPDYDFNIESVKVERKFIDIYFCLRDGFPLEDIAKRFRVAPPSVPAWIQKLERLFHSFWLISGSVPSHLKDLAVKTYRCDRCLKIDRKYRDQCRNCGFDMNPHESKIRMSLYPWPRVCGTHDLQDKRALKRQRMTIEKCGV